MEAHDQYLDDIDCLNSEAPGKISVHPGCAAVVVFIYINNCRTCTVIIASKLLGCGILCLLKLSLKIFTRGAFSRCIVLHE